MTGFALLYQIDINSYRDRNKKIKQIDKKNKNIARDRLLSGLVSRTAMEATISGTVVVKNLFTIPCKYLFSEVSVQSPSVNSFAYGGTVISG